MNQTALQAYQSVGVESRIEVANAHELVAMLFRGLLDRLGTAAAALAADDIAEKGKAIGEAISIVDSLRASVDLTRGGDIAENLVAVYDFVENHLVSANLASDGDRLAEARNIISELSHGWDAIPLEVRQSAD